MLSSYAELKKVNPEFPILIREAAGAEPKLVARYGALVACCHGGCRMFGGLVGRMGGHVAGAVGQLGRGSYERDS